jgi:hypothetical protein
MSNSYLQKTRNPLLVKDDVGRAKPSCYDLPGEEFAYGRPDNPDFEGAREVTMQWVSHVARPRPEENVQDFRKLNKMSTKAGVLKAANLREFRRENPVRLAPTLASGPPPKVFPSEVVPSFTYGKQGRPSTPIAAVISNQFAAEYEQALEENYAQYEREKMEIGFRKIQTTKASEGHALNSRKVVTEEKKEPFKLSKFKNVQPKMKLPDRLKEAQAAAAVTTPDGGAVVDPGAAVA